MNKQFMRVLFPDLVQKVNEKKCPFCGKVILTKEFRDDISLREYGISGICQACQDEYQLS